jgi:hypothetical protein
MTDRPHDEVLAKEEARINAQVILDVLYHGRVQPETQRQATAALRAWMEAELDRDKAE